MLVLVVRSEEDGRVGSDLRGKALQGLVSRVALPG